MRIISNFHDYYDGIQRMGQDRETIYLRRPQEEYQEIDFAGGSTSPFIMHGSWYRPVITLIVGFCGKIYPGLMYYEGIKRRFLYDQAEVEAFDKKHPDYKILPWCQNWNDFFNQKCPFEFKKPIFVFEKYRDQGFVLTWNAQLNNYDFAKVVEPYTAYQELAMWVGAQARPEKEIAEVSDEVKVESHGFDKYSFRKDKKRK